MHPQFVRSILTILLISVAPFSFGSSVEISGGQTVVSAVESGEPSSTGGAYNNPTGIPIGGDFFLYAQGGNWDHGPGGSCPGDKILAFKNPYTSTGMTTPFQFVTRISPCDGAAYGPGQVFSSNGQYYMVADRSDTVTFQELVLGTSTNGVQWTWQDFIRHTGSVEIYSPVLVSGLSWFVCNPGCFSHTNWWGFFPFTTPGRGTGRISVDVSNQYPRGFRVKILSGGQWVTVDDYTGEFSFTPDSVWNDVGVRSLAWDEDHWELWAFTNVPHNGCSPCDGEYDNGFAGTTFKFRNVYSEGSSLGPIQQVYSMVRCMPSDSHVGRMFPFRVNDPSGSKLLYSSTTDENICTTTNPFAGSYVVVTELDD